MAESRQMAHRIPLFPSTVSGQRRSRSIGINQPGRAAGDAGAEVARPAAAADTSDAIISIEPQLEQYVVACLCPIGEASSQQ